MTNFSILLSFLDFIANFCGIDKNPSKYQIEIVKVPHNPQISKLALEHGNYCFKKEVLQVMAIQNDSSRLQSKRFKSNFSPTSFE